MDIRYKTNNNKLKKNYTQQAFSSVLFSKGRRTESFFTEDSKLYITPRQQRALDKGVVFKSGMHQWDALSNRVVRQYQTYRCSRTDTLYQMLLGRYEALRGDVQQASKSFIGQLSMAQLWNMSIVGAILLGMVSMSMIYRFLGPGASAQDLATVPQVAEQTTAGPVPASVSGGAATAGEKNTAGIDPALDAQQKSKSDFEKKVRAMVKGQPIEDMLPYLLDKDQTVAAFMIAIAKQESSWGEHVPVLNGQDCYNDWGYRQQRQLLGTGGHTCFNSRKDAVDTVAKRIKTLAITEGRNTPEKMILWKCGSGCVGDASEQRWIGTVSSVYDELMAKS